MFKLSSNTTFKREITVVIPTDEGSSKGTFTATFKRLPQSRIDTLVDDQSDEGGDRQLLDEILVAVDGIADANGDPMPSDEKTLDMVKDDACARVALVTDYFHAIQSKNQRKN